ncbi:MAG TPA: branched-chain-amino-acid transaminase [bacterium]|nr:branched-chain-amino-acid transaminase [bacterium]
MKIWLNGKLLEKEDAKISVFDHGLLYGDGVFEGIRAYKGRVFKLGEHLERLYDSAKAIMLEIPLSVGQFEKAVLETLRGNKLREAYIRAVVTRGTGDLGLDPRKCPRPTIFIITDKIVLYPQEFYENGLRIITVSTRRNIPEAVNPGIKSLNYLNNILAKIEANLGGYPEAIMLNKDGFVAECTGDNIFICRDGVLTTPPSSIGALKGITRDTVMEIARKKLKLEVREELFTRFHLFTSGECFLTGTAAEVIPVTEIDGRKIGSGIPGKNTLRIMKEFRKLTGSQGTRI